MHYMCSPHVVNKAIATSQVLLTKKRQTSITHTHTLYKNEGMY